MGKKRNAVVLLSGGIDSATALYIAIKKGYRPHALIFDYGQRHKKEIISAVSIAKRARSPYRIIKLPFAWKGSSLLKKSSPLPAGRTLREIKRGIPSTYVPARNLIFLSVAASFAESIGSNAIFIGAHAEDYSGYPDCRDEFFRSFEITARKGMKAFGIKVHAPLARKNKKDIIKTALKLGVSLHLTWSCYKGAKRPCGVCDSCFFRKKAFQELGIKDIRHD